jgi:hypothetical protein
MAQDSSAKVHAGSMIVSSSKAYIGSSTASLAIHGSGSEVVSVDGTNGRLFSVTDEMSGSIFSANTVAGIPVIEAKSDYEVRLDPFNNGKVSVGSYILQPNQPAFQVRGLGSDLTLTTSAVAATFNGETFDQGGNMTTTTFTAPVTGKYMFSAGGLFDGHTEGDYIVLQIFTSNFTYMTDLGRGARGTTNHGTLSILADMDVSDTAQMRVVNNTSGRGQLKSDNYWTYFSGYLVC